MLSWIINIHRSVLLPKEIIFTTNLAYCILSCQTSTGFWSSQALFKLKLNPENKTIFWLQWTSIVPPFFAPFPDTLILRIQLLNFSSSPRVWRGQPPLKPSGNILRWSFHIFQRILKDFWQTENAETASRIYCFVHYTLFLKTFFRFFTSKNVLN